MKFVEWVKISEELMTVAVSEETYQNDLRYERAVWPEKFATGDELVPCLERITLALQGIDLSLEKLADKPPIEINMPNVGDGD